MELMTEQVGKQTERETLRRPDRFAVSGGSDRKWGKKENKKRRLTSGRDRWQTSSSNHDRNQMYMKDREREEDD